MSSYDQWGLPPGTLKFSELSSRRARRVTGSGVLPLERQHNKEPREAAQKQQFKKMPGIYAKKIYLLISQQHLFTNLTTCARGAGIFRRLF